MHRDRSHATVLEALAHGPATTMEVAEAANLTRHQASHLLHILLAQGEAIRTEMCGEWSGWALPGYERPAAAPKATAAARDDDEWYRPVETPEERQALVAEALADGPLAMSELTGRLRMRGVNAVLTVMRQVGEVKQVGSGGQTRWALSSYVAPEKAPVIVRPDQARFNSFITPKPSPSREPSWWTKPVSRDAWYQLAHEAGEELITEGKTRGSDAE